MSSTDIATVLDPNNPAIQQYRQQAPELLAIAEGISITTDADLLLAAEHTKSATGAVKAIKALFSPAKKALDEAKRQITGLENTLLDGFQRADEILRKKVTLYHTLRRQQAEAEQRARAEAERRIREDALIEQAAQLENLANTTGDEHFRKAAEQTLNIPVRPPVVECDLPKVAGLTFREEVGFKVVDMTALVSAAATGQVSIQALQANEKWLRTEASQRAAALRDGDVLFPGVVVTKTNDVSVRTR